MRVHEEETSLAIFDCDGKRSSNHSSFHDLMVRRVKMTLLVLNGAFC